MIKIHTPSIDLKVSSFDHKSSSIDFFLDPPNCFQCKRLVFEYGPMILINAEKFLETTDICTALHACKANTTDLDANVTKEIPLLSDS